MGCANCKQTHPLMWGALCDPCYKYRYRHGMDRPPALFKPHKATAQPGTCKNCKDEAPRLQRERCQACYTFRYRNGYDRPPHGIRRKRTA